MTLFNHNIDSIRQGLLARKFTAHELALEALANAQAENPKTNAYLTFSPDRALLTALEVDKKIAAGEDPGALAGVPIAIKDVILTQRRPHHLRIAPARQLHPSLRRDRRRAHRAGRRRHHRKNQLRRVRHGIVQ